MTMVCPSLDGGAIVDWMMDVIGGLIVDEDGDDDDDDDGGGAEVDGDGFEIFVSVSVACAGVVTILSAGTHSRRTHTKMIKEKWKKKNKIIYKNDVNDAFDKKQMKTTNMCVCLIGAE